MWWEIPSKTLTSFRLIRDELLCQWDDSADATISTFPEHRSTGKGAVWTWKQAYCQTSVEEDMFSSVRRFSLLDVTWDRDWTLRRTAGLSCSWKCPDWSKKGLWGKGINKKDVTSSGGHLGEWVITCVAFSNSSLVWLTTLWVSCSWDWSWLFSLETSSNNCRDRETRLCGRWSRVPAVPVHE